VSTFEIVMELLQHPHYKKLLAFIENFLDAFADSGGLGLRGDGGKIEFTHKQSSVHHPNDLIAQVPDRRSRTRASRHQPRPIEIIFGATTLSEQESMWRCHVLPRLPPAFQELFLMRIMDRTTVPDSLWGDFMATVLEPLFRVIDGRRNSSIVKSQFANHLWKTHADWTWIRTDWLVHTKTVAFEGPLDALWMHVVCLFQVEEAIVNTILEFPEPFRWHVLYAFLDLPLSSRNNKAFMEKFFTLAWSNSFIHALQHPLFHVGANARTGICASSAVATAGERERIVALGERTGCHHCGHIHPQPKWSASLNYWILDHQPPRSKRLAKRMRLGQLLIGPILTDDLVYAVGAFGEDTWVDGKVAELAAERYFETRQGKSVALVPYVKATKKALIAYLERFNAYFAQHDGEFRFYLHCHDCAGLQGGLMQNLVKLGKEVAARRKRIAAGKATTQEKVYFLQCLAQLHDLLDECFDPKRPMLRFDHPGGKPSIQATRSSGTAQQRETLVGLANGSERRTQAMSALGVENALVLHYGAAACHSCSANVAVPGSLWTADHVSPSFLVELGLRTGPQILYPQCVYCRKAQSVLAAAFRRAWLAADSATAWDEAWSRFVGGGTANPDGGDTSKSWIDPTQGDEADEEDEDDEDDDIEPEDDAPPPQPPMTSGGGACVTVGIGRLSCLEQDVNTCGQRAAYNATRMLANEGNDIVLAAALENEAALHGIGPMQLDIADNQVRDLLDQEGGQAVALVSTIQHVKQLVADGSMCADAGDQALYAFAHGTAARAYVVINTLANALVLPSFSMPGTGSAKVGHYIAVRLSRAMDHSIVANYADSLAGGMPRDGLIGDLIDALNGE
jgi:hypothetical protein